MAVKARDHPVGLAARLADPAQVVLDVGLAAGAAQGERLAANDAFTEQLQLFLALGARFRLTVEVLAVARPRLVEAELAAHPLERIESCAIHRVGIAERKRVDTRAAAEIRPLRA